MNLTLQNKRALVTGGSRGIGAALAIQFIRSGITETFGLQGP